LVASLKLDVIMVNANPAAQAVKEATSSTPIVMLLVSDPVGAGWYLAFLGPAAI
jgi:ABC-type uncharacterized transport system substrate-binding protein